MNIKINGEKASVLNNISLRSFLEQIGQSEVQVAVALNRQVVPRAKLNEIQLKENDEVEIVAPFPGG